MHSSRGRGGDAENADGGGRKTKKMWYYVGENGKEEGPFSRRRMKFWFDKGYLPHSLRVRYGENGQWVELTKIEHPFVKNDSKKGTAASLPSLPVSSSSSLESKKRTGMAARKQKKPIPKLQWYYYDEKKIVQGPYSSHTMQHWIEKGYLRPDLIVKCGEDGHWTPLKTLGKKPFHQHPDRKKKTFGFFYIDEKKRERGPFKFSHMAHWAKNGYLPAKLMLRVNNGPFVRFDSLRAAFASGDADQAKILYARAAAAIGDRSGQQRSVRAGERRMSDRDLKVANEKLAEEKRRLEEAERKRVIDAERAAREKMAEAERVAKEIAETQRIAKEKAESERIAREKAEAERIAKEKAEAERIAKEKAETERLTREKAETERIAREEAEAERIAKEKAETERIAREKAEAGRIAKEKAETERIAREKAEAERIAKEKAETERIAREKAEADRIAKEKAEAERVTREKAEAGRIAKEKAETERIAREKAEAELTREKAEAGRIAKEKAETERIAREKAEAERIAKEKAETERIAREKAEADRIAKEKAETERIAREKAEADRIAKEKAETERIAREKAEADRIAKEKAETERIAREKAEADRIAKGKAETERIAQEKAEADRIAKEKAETERIAKEKAEADRIAKEKAEADRIAKEKTEADRIAKEKAESERVAKEKAETERIAKEKAESERIAREKADAERIAKEKTEAERTAKEKAGVAKKKAAKTTTSATKKKKKRSTKTAKLAAKLGLDVSKIRFGGPPPKKKTLTNSAATSSTTTTQHVDEKGALLSRPTQIKKRRRRPKARSFEALVHKKPPVTLESDDVAESAKKTPAAASKMSDTASSTSTTANATTVNNETKTAIATARTTSKIAKKFFGDPWNQLSSWNDTDDQCDEFKPNSFKSYKCESCGRTIDEHRRDAVKHAKEVLKAIDSRGGASRILDDGTPKGCKGELWLGGQAGITKEFFKTQNIKLCITAAAGLNKRFRGFTKRRKAACDANGAALLSIKWEDNDKQVIEWDEVREAVERIHAIRMTGGSVVVHCAAGQSRSSTVVMAYLLGYYKKTAKVDKALSFAQSKRPMVRPNDGFLRQLRAFVKAKRFKLL
eukprot:g638.t1